MKTIRVGNAAGFWGDQLSVPRLLAESGRLDYLTLEYLAELTMSILAHQKSREPEKGYVADFPAAIENLTNCLKVQPELRIVTNAGGMNPTSCARAVADVLLKAGLSRVSLAVVTGDDLFPALDEFRAQGEPFANLDNGEAFEDIRERVVSANVYFGAAGIVEALEAGGRIVIAGRVADASLAVGPAIYEFGWAWSDWDRLAAATIAGHIIECGAQATGGMYSDWTSKLSLADVGYPIAEISEEASVVITKPEGTGGTVTTGTVAEQLVYEIGDPTRYLTPDVIADFSAVQLTQDGENRVAVRGGRGRPAPETLKVSVAYHDGYMVSGILVIAGRDAVSKARRCAEIVFERVRRVGFELERTNVECLGAGDSLPGVWMRRDDPPEVVLRISAWHPTRDAVERLSRELAPLVTSGPPGVTGYTGGRPRPRQVLAYWPTSISRTRVSPILTVKPAEEWLS